MRSARAVLLLLTLVLCSALAASAQTPPPIVQTQRIVSGNLALNSGANATNSVVRIQLSYCGGNAGRVIAADGSVTMISFQPFDVRPSSSGTPPQGLPWSTPLYGNDQIWCGVQQGVSRWRITPIYNGVSGDAVDYQVNSCAAYITLNAGAACDAVTTASFFDIDSAPLCIGGGNPGTRTYDCALHFPYVVPPPPPIQGPPGPQGPPGTSGANPGTAPQVAYYSTTGNQVSGDPRFTDNATTLAYQGDAYVRGSQTIDTMLYVNGAYYMDTTPTISPMAPAPAGRSAMGVSSDYNFYISANGGTPAKICTQGDSTCGGGGSGNVSPGTPTYMAIYTAATQVGSDPNFYDTSGTLSYLGNSYTQGNDTVDNILYVNGAYYMDTTPTASPAVAAPTGRSSMSVSTDGNFYISNNSTTPVAAGAPQEVCTAGNGACPTGSGGSTQGPYPLQNCTPDQSGYTFYGVSSLTNYFFAHWEFGFGATSFPIYINCTIKLPHVLPTGTAKILLGSLSANDTSAGHTMTFATCDQVVTTTVNVGTLACAATQNFTTTTTAYAPSTLTFNLQSTPTTDAMLVVEIKATAISSLTTNVLMNGAFLEWQ